MDPLLIKLNAALAAVEARHVRDTMTIKIIQSIIKDHQEGRLTWDKESREALEALVNIEVRNVP